MIILYFSFAGTAVPTVDTGMSTCSYIGTDIHKETHGIMLLISVLNGPPTAVECQWNDQTLITSTAITISNSTAPISSRVNIVLSIPFITTPARSNVICSVRNRAGSSNFQCNLQGDLIIILMLLLSLIYI